MVPFVVHRATIQYGLNINLFDQFYTFHFWTTKKVEKILVLHKRDYTQKIPHDFFFIIQPKDGTGPDWLGYVVGKSQICDLFYFPDLRTIYLR